MPLLLDQLGPCPVCGAAVAVTGPLFRKHMDFHEALGHVDFFEQRLRGQGDETPTAKLPPIGDTIRRRPPVPTSAPILELSGAELIRGLMAELEHELQAEGDPE